MVAEEMVFNFSGLNSSGPVVNYCELNQLAMLEQTQKFPVVVFLLFLATLVCLLYYTIFWPRMPEGSFKRVYGLVILCVGVVCSTVGVYLAAYTTFHITRELDGLIQTCLGWFAGFMFLVVLWVNREALVDRFKKIRGL